MDLRDCIWIWIFVMPYHKMKKLFQFIVMWIKWCHCYDNTFYETRKNKLNL